jgi:Ca-activated chloride channel family protein
MYDFEHPEYWYYLIAVVFFVGLFLMTAWWRRSALRKYGDLTLVKRLIPDQPRFKHIARLIVFCLAWIALVVALTNPRQGTKLEKVKRQGVDVVIALDVSKSMLAEDIRPNRLARAKNFISKMIDKMEGDRVALVVFAGNAYLQMPLTVDYSASKMFLNNVNTNIVPTQGTAIGEAITKGNEVFVSGEDKFKALVIITDGENHEEDAKEIAKASADSGVIIHTVGIGTPKGAPIPVYTNGVQTAFKKDKQGSIVLSKLNEQMLQELAVYSGGEYFRMASGDDQVNSIMELISGMEKKEFEERVFTEFDDKFQYPLAVALLLLIFELLITNRRSRWFSKLLYFE